MILKFSFAVIFFPLFLGQLAFSQQGREVKRSPEKQTLEHILEDSSVYHFEYALLFKSMSGEFVLQDTIEGLLAKNADDTIYGSMFYISGLLSDFLYTKGRLVMWDHKNKTKQANITPEKFKHTKFFNIYVYDPLLDLRYYSNLSEDEDLVFESDSIYKIKFKNKAHLDSFSEEVYLGGKGLPKKQVIKIYLQGMVQRKRYKLLTFEKTNYSYSKIDEISDNNRLYAKNPVSNGGKEQISEANNVEYKELECCTLEGMDDSTYKLIDLISPKHGTLIKFWYTSCAPCLFADRKLDKMQIDKEMKVINVNIYDSPKEIKKYLRRNGKYDEVEKHYRDTSGVHEKIGIKYYPTFLYIDPEEKEIEMRYGWSQKIEEWIRSLTQK